MFNQTLRNVEGVIKANKGPKTLYVYKSRLKFYPTLLVLIF